MSSSSKRVLIFRLPGEESAQNAARLAQTLVGSGCDVTMAPYWPDGQASWHSETCLLEVDIGSAPRMSEFALKRQYGLTLDLLELLAHNFATEPISADLLLPESIWHQRLRGIAVKLLEMFEREKPDVIFIAHGAEIISRIITEVAAFSGIRALYWESGFFPGYLYVDAQAPHFFRGLCASDTQQPLLSASPETHAFIKAWRAARQSKYSQDHTQESAFLKWKARDNRPILFIAGQVPTDANAVVNLGEHASLNDLYAFVLAQVSSDWRILFKPHPKAAPDSIKLPHPVGDDLMVADIDIHTAIENSDAVFAHSSNAGLEAALLGKPVILSGQPIYSGYGFTYEIGTDETIAIPNHLDPAQPDSVACAVEHILAHSLIKDGAIQMMRSRLEAARPPVRNINHATHYSKKIQDLIGAAHSLHSQLKTTPRLEQALMLISADERSTLFVHDAILDTREHYYAGPQVPRSVLAPHPLRGHKQDGVETLAVRLEECAFPQAYVEHMLSQHPSGIRIGCLFNTSPEPASAQSFSADDIMHMCSELQAQCTFVVDKDNADNQIASLIISRQRYQHTHIDTPPYLEWHIPAEAFSYASPLSHPCPNRIPIESTHKNFIYGPYISLPKGEWELTWLAPTASWRARMRAMLAWPLWKRLKMEIIEQQAGHPAKVTKVAFFKYRARITTDPHAIYEFRTAYSPPHRAKSLIAPSFSGIWFKKIK